MLFTNGTGTGKTFTGLGIIKRFEQQGKTNVIILVPGDAVSAAWVDAGKLLGLTITPLADTKDAGRGIVITTYANFGQNTALHTRKWDLFVPDESHKLSQGKEGGTTGALQTLRGLTFHPRGFFAWWDMVDRSELEQMRQSRERMKIALEVRPIVPEEVDRLEAEVKKWNAWYNDMQPKREAEYAQLGKARPKALFLSATPFAYHKSVDWAEGFLFDYDENHSETSAYNGGSAYDQFYMRHFGYRMRYNKLTQPDASVDTSIMEMGFNQWLKDRGALSSRRLDVEPDYERAFISVRSEIGSAIEEAMEYLREQKYYDLLKVFMARFDYHQRMYLLEAVKAREAVPIIREYIAKGRKVVLFHDFNKGGGFDPFAVIRNSKAKEAAAVMAAKPHWFAIDLDDVYLSPLQRIEREFPNVVFVNGLQKKGSKPINAAAFQRDDGPDLIMVQSDAGQEGISLHDTTGKKPRVLMHLGMPTKPTSAIQIEGRIYRTGQASDAIMRYLTIGTNWERWAFANTIAQRAETAENLSLGEEARALKDAFIDAYENAGEYPPGREGEGKGGKAADARQASAVTPWAKAKTYYWATRKRSGKWKSAEGTDYFATPEPVGLKMVEWLDLKADEKVLEPSAGHGAIARWMPAHLTSRAIEPSLELASRLRMVLPSSADLKNERFEDHDIVNKYDGIVMNPPFGLGGSTAIPHVAKAAQHLNDGGRIVALIPRGPAADKRFDKWLYEDAKGSGQDLYLVADIELPTLIFERAGTAVATRIVVLEKSLNEDRAARIQSVQRDLSDAETIGELFDRVENMDVPERQRVPERAAPVQSSNWELAPHTSNKGEAWFKAKPLERRDGSEWERAKTAAKDNGGFYSTFTRSFLFKTEEGRAAFMRAVEEPEGNLSRARPVLFSVAEEDLESVIDAARKALPHMPNVVVADTPTSSIVPRGLQRRIQDAGGASGASWQGSIYLFRNALQSLDDAQAVLAHETLHEALATMGKQKAELLREMRDTNKTLRLAAEMMRMQHPDMGELESIEEVLADYASEGKHPTLLQRLVNFIRKVLHAMSFGRLANKWTDGEVLALVVNAPRVFRNQTTKQRLYGSGALSRVSPWANGEMAKMIATRGSVASAREWAYRLNAWARKGYFPASDLEASGILAWLDGRPGRLSIETMLERLKGSDYQSAGEDINELLEEFGRPAASIMDAERSLDAGARVFLVHEMGDEPTEVFSTERFKGYVADQIIILESGRLSRTLTDPLQSVRYTADDLQAVEDKLARRAPRGPIDKLFQTLTQGLRIDRVTAKVIDGTLEKIDGFLTKAQPEGWERVKAGFVDQYGLPEAVSDRRAVMQGRVRSGLRGVKHVLDDLATLTRAESRVFYEYMNGDRSLADTLSENLPPESVEIIRTVKKVIDDLSQEAVRLGDLSPESFERNRWSYVHRSYQRFVLEAPAQLKSEMQRSLRIRGDQYKGRGMQELEPMARLKNVAPDWWGRKLREGKADAGLKGQRFIRFERRAPVGEGTEDLPGMGTLGRRGRLLEVAYWPAEESIPSRFEAWERDAAPWQVRDTKGDKVVLWRDFTQDERRAMGEIDEVRYAIAATLHRAIRDVETSRMLEWLAVHQGKTEEQVPRGATKVEARESLLRAFKPDEWVQVPVSDIPNTGGVKRYGKLAGMWVPGPVWNDVRQITGQRVQPFGELYGDLLRAWKISKTALSLPVHMNNVMSNVIMADWHDVTARSVARALHVIVHRDRPDNARIIERFEDAGGSEGLYALSELQREQVQPLLEQLRAEVDAVDPAHGLARAGNVVSLITQMRFREAFAAAAQSKPGKAAAWVGQKLTQAYEDEDMVFRLAAFMQAKADGRSDADAGAAARKSFLDYQINAPWVNLMRSTMFPFFAFTYRAVPMLVDVVAHKPWKMLKWASIFGALNALGYLMSGGDEDKERKLLPDEKAGRTIFATPKLVRMPWNDANGSPVFLDIRRWIPVGDLVDWGQTHSAVPIPPQITPGGPLALLFEVMLNKQGFTGKPITLETDTAGETTDKFAAYLWRSFAPNTPGVPWAYSTSAILDAGGGKTDVFGREQSVVQSLASAAGVKLSSYPADVAKRNIGAEFATQDAEIKRNIQSLARELQRMGISEEDFRRKVEAQMQKRRDLARETMDRLQ